MKIVLRLKLGVSMSNKNLSTELSFMGARFCFSSDNKETLRASLLFVLHVAEQVHAEYPSSDITHVLALSCMRLSEFLCNAQNGNDDISTKMEQCESFVARIVELLSVQNVHA
jgi:hypothetical protein